LVAIGIVRFDSARMPKAVVREMHAFRAAHVTDANDRENRAERKEVCLEGIFRIVWTIQTPVVGVTALSNSD
jgi:hypothetical protein